MEKYFLHNGYCGWSYGTPSDPQLVTVEDAAEIMKRANLVADQVSLVVPAAQYSDGSDKLYSVTGNNRFIFLGQVGQCSDVNQEKVNTPIEIQW
jgi:hypothetical protein